MFRDILSAAALQSLGIVGLMISFFTFVLVLAWVFRRGSKAYYEETAKLALDEASEYPRTISQSH